jgi:hypothetical protein
MIHSTKPIDDATPLDDISGLKLSRDKVYSLREIYVAKAYLKSNSNFKFV